MSVSSVVMRVLSTVKAYGGTIGNTAVVLLVFAAEVIVRDGVFYCPCIPQTDLQVMYNTSTYPDPDPTRVYYGVCFIVWPAIVLLLLGMALSMQTQRCLTAYSHSCRPSNICRATQYFCVHGASVLVPPAAWLTFVFIDGRYYECIVSRLPSSCIPTEPSSVPLPTSTSTSLSEDQISNNLKDLVEENLHHRAVSQLIGWSAIGLGITIACLVMLLQRCCSSNTYYQTMYMQTLREKELEAFAKVTETTLMKQMEDKWNLFFQKAEFGDWEAISDLPAGSPHRYLQKYYYSAFDEWMPRDNDASQLEETKDTNNVMTDKKIKAVTLGSLGEPHKKVNLKKAGSLDETKFSTSQEKLVVNAQDAEVEGSSQSFENPVYSSAISSPNGTLNTENPELPNESTKTT